MAETTTIARPYARAAFAAASDEEDGLAKWSQMLQFAAGVADDPQMQAILADPEHDDAVKAGLILDISSAQLSGAGSNFIKLLAENQRLDILPEIAAVYEELRAEAEKTVEAEMVSAFAVSDEQREKIAAALSRRLEREVVLKVTVDEALIGGAVIRAGDLVIDGSAHAKLAKLSAQLGR